MILSDEFLHIALTCVLIFCARIMDVSIGTLRIIFVSKGYRRIAPLLGFVEVFIWIMAISRIMQHIDRFAYYVAYAAGFATGNWIGMILEERLAIGIERLRLMVSRIDVEGVRKAIPVDFQVVSYDAEFDQQPVVVLEITTNRKQVPILLKAVQTPYPSIRFSREDVRASNLLKNSSANFK